MKRIIIFDTTLRDGEQSPGATLNREEKIIIAKQLEKLGVDYIESGFPVASEDDFNAVKEIAESVNTGVAALARCRNEDIRKAWEAIKNSKKSRIHVFMSSSKIHLKHQFKIDENEALEVATEGVRLAKKYTDDVEFSPMDATRSEKEFLFKMIKSAVANGATTINIPDTVGYSMPGEFGALIREIRELVGESINISVHCHNDLGLAVANSLEAVKNGANQIETTINGIGERAGNTAMEEVVMSFHTRKSYFNAETNINLKQICKTSKLVEKLTGIKVQRNKAIVGKNAFAHEAGIHQHGILSNKETYEIMSPEIIGRKTEIVIGKHSGRHAVESVLKRMGVCLDEEKVKKITKKVKNLADKKKCVLEKDIIDIVNNLNQGKIS